MKIWNTNDVLIILKGDQRRAIQEMLKSRSFALLKITVNENTDYHSSVYRHTYMRYCAIRNRGSETLFYQCEYCLFMDSGWKDEDKNIQPMIKRIDDVKDFDVRQKITAILDKNSKEYYSADSDHSFEYESWSKTVRASYFVTRFHSDPLWEADPVCLLNFRLSVFVLPGTISPCKSKRFSANKLACETINGDQYVIDSIHFNTDICFNLQEFEKLIDAYFYEISLA